MTAADVFLQQVVNGLTIGMIYALIALGYTMVYGIVQLINFAHGEIFMVGAYIGLFICLIFQRAGTGSGNLVFFLPTMMLFVMAGTALLGWIVEKSTYKPLRHAPRLAPLITAIGVSFVLQNAVMLLFGPADKSFPSVIPIHKFDLANVTITNLQVLIAVISISLMAALHFFIQYTTTGKAMRALADDIKAASLMGINVDRVIAMAFCVGSALAGAGGVLFGLYYSTINFHDGYLAGLKAFTAAVLGGIGNIPGAMIGGVLIGVLEGLGAGYLSSEWKNVFAFFILILILLFRPSGLLGARVVKKV
ncbi:MAG TPA: branched-chain amino acid ABC transporter permease [Verrucomicrobiae bacterium]|jgi:branched-chain amino acid transport system permease protein|nr:branched-chain amino acid ABC transporter permease [Verrucomicrobiae bacterium]